MKKPFHTKHTKRKHRKELKRIPIRKAKRQATWLESLLLRNPTKQTRSRKPISSKSMRDLSMRDLFAGLSKPAIKLGKDRS